MRTTLDIDDDVLLAAKAIGRRERRSLGEVVSELARRSLTMAPAPGAAEPPSFLRSGPTLRRCSIPR